VLREQDTPNAATNPGPSPRNPFEANAAGFSG